MGHSTSTNPIYEITNVKPIEKIPSPILIQGITMYSGSNVFKFASLINGMLNHEFRTKEKIADYLELYQEVYNKEDMVNMTLRNFNLEEFHRYEMIKEMTMHHIHEFDQFIKIIINLDNATDDDRLVLDYLVDRLIPKSIDTIILHHREKHGVNVGRNCIINYAVNLYKTANMFFRFLTMTIFIVVLDTYILKYQVSILKMYRLLDVLVLFHHWQNIKRKLLIN